jgi:hypothetical protein
MNLPLQGRERIRKLCALSRPEGARDVFEPPGTHPGKSGWRRRSWQFPAAILTTMTLR